LFRNDDSISLDGMETLVSYRIDEGIGTVTMNDGKVNALSLPMLGQLNSAFDRAESEAAVVVLTGREGVFSAGFDLTTLRAGGPDALAMVQGGFELASRMLSFPAPVVIACSGHAIAMGMFLLLSGDYAVGVAGPYKITANEVAIGLTIPMAGVEICRQRLTPAHLVRTLLLAEVFAPEDAVGAGFVDRVVPLVELPETARTIAAGLSRLDLKAHTISKLRVRADLLKAIKASIDSDTAALATQPPSNSQ
jgi:enoyl-CoA hydratase